MTEKRKVGRPRKTSTPVKTEKKNINWKQKCEMLEQELKMQKEFHKAFAVNAKEILQAQSNTQHMILEVVLNGYHSIQEQCKAAINLKGEIDIADVEYTVNFAKKVLLHQFSNLVDTEED
jgi:hypothetical protein